MSNPPCRRGLHCHDGPCFPDETKPCWTGKESDKTTAQANDDDTTLEQETVAALVQELRQAIELLESGHVTALALAFAYRTDGSPGHGYATTYGQVTDSVADRCLVSAGLDAVKQRVMADLAQLDRLEGLVLTVTR